GDAPQHAEGGRHGVAATLDRQFHDLLWVEVVEVGGERGATRMLDALVDGQDRQVARAPESTVGEQRLEVAKYAGRPVGRSVQPVDSVRARQLQPLLADTACLVAEKFVSVGAEQL